MTTAEEIIELLEEWAPLSYAEGYDNPGFLVGRRRQPVHTVMVAVDASESVIEQAVLQQADLLITHHPLIFHPLKKITDEERVGKRLLQLIEHGIALYSAHTNMDTAPGGNNDYAAALLGLKQIRAALQPGEQPCLRIGELSEPCSLKELADLTKNQFALPYIRMIGESDKKVKRVAVCTGSGMDFMPLAIKEGADVFITGDIRYHDADEAKAAGLCLIDASHFGTDHLSVRHIADTLREWAIEMERDICVYEADEQELYQLQ